MRSPRLFSPIATASMFVAALLVGCALRSGVAGVPTTVDHYVLQGQQPPAQWLQFFAPTPRGNSWGGDTVTVGPKHTLWFTEMAKNMIAEVDMTGAIKEIAVNTQPQYIIEGPDKNVWVALYLANGSGSIDRISSNGFVATYPILGNALGLANGADGRIWFINRAPDLSTFELGAVTVYGQITLYPLSQQGESLNGLAQGPDGNVWYTASANQIGYVGKVTPQGQITEYPLPSNITAGSLAAGSDGKIWFVAFDSSGGVGIGRIDTDGTSYTLYPTPTNPTWIVQGQKGFMWFVAYAAGPSGWEVDQISEGGALTRNSLPTGDVYLGSVAYGPDGNLWLPDAKNDAIDVFVRRLLSVTPPSLSIPVGQTQTFTANETGYKGKFTASGCPSSVATISQTESGIFSVTGNGAGYCSILVRDSSLNSAPVAIQVTL